MSMVKALVISGLLLSVACAGAPIARAQEPRSPKDDEREQAFVQALRRDDPAGADRYVELRDARHTAMTDLTRAQTQYNAAGPELRSVFVASLRSAERRYAETSLALLDFLDARDQRMITKLQEEIGRINAILEQHRKIRADFEKMLHAP
jgi:hypothetical protein